MKMVKYEGRKTVAELLEDPFLKDAGEVKLELGVFGMQKIKGKIFY